ncbi:hypothetical protein IFM89_027154, partial [Coptis chinensis]
SKAHVVARYPKASGAILVDNLNIINVDIILNSTVSGEALALVIEFKLYINAYLEERITSPMRSLANIIAFNDKFSDLVVTNLNKLSEDGLVKLMKENKLDALVTPSADIAPILAIGDFRELTLHRIQYEKGCHLVSILED